MIVMDRENLHAPGWSHVLSTTNDLEELEAFRERVGAPPPALQLRNPHRPHLDLKGEPRDRALGYFDILIFDRTTEMVRFLRAAGEVAAVLAAAD